MKYLNLERRKNMKGITLISLVITIIVLLILAGVTIVTLTGDNGLLTKAGEAKQANEEVTALEKIKVEVAGSYGLTGELDIDRLNANLSHISGLIYNEKLLNDTNKITELPVTVVLNGHKISINEKGNVAICVPYSELQIGDYINIDIKYENVGNYLPKNDYTGWRVLSVNENSIKLVSSGVPITYMHGTDSSISMPNLTTNFFNTEISDVARKYYTFRTCGITNSYGNRINVIEDLKNLFLNNKYIATTQVDEKKIPQVQSVTLQDYNNVLSKNLVVGSAINNNSMTALKMNENQYVPTWIATPRFIWLSYGVL